MTYAIIEAGGHQLRIEVGRFYDIDYVPQSKPEAQLFFQRILLLSYQTETIFGKPWIPGSYVRAKVLYHFQKKNSFRKHTYNFLILNQVLLNIHYNPRS